MSRTVPSAIQTALDTRSTTLARCWLIVRADGQRFGFTDHDAELAFDPDGNGSVTFMPGSGLGVGSAIVTTANGATDNSESTGIFSNDITQADLEAGIWDYSTVSPLMVNHQSLGDVVKMPGAGRIGQIQAGDFGYAVELRSITDALNQTIGDRYSALCRAQFCDSDCGLTAGTYTTTDAVTVATSNLVFTTTLGDDDDYWNGGTLTWTSGDNDTYSREVKSFASGVITLVLAMPLDVAVSDSFSIIRGCAKDIDACVAHSNAVNFRGEPHVPGESIFKVGGQH